jgi:coronatine-insensitive protein 1
VLDVPAVGDLLRLRPTTLAAPLECLKAVHLRRMTVTYDDIAELVRARGYMLQVLKLDKLR